MPQMLDVAAALGASLGRETWDPCSIVEYAIPSVDPHDVHLIRT